MPQQVRRRVQRARRRARWVAGPVAHCGGGRYERTTGANRGGDAGLALARSLQRQRSAAVSDKARKMAKVVVLGTMYGMGDAEGARKMEVSKAEAERVRRQFLQRFPGIPRFMRRTKDFARQHGYVRLPSGRRRPLP